MIDKHNSTAANTLEENRNVFIGVCHCHLVHIAASHARDSISEVLDGNIENLCIDFYCWFYKSSKRKDKLAEYYFKPCICTMVFFGTLHGRNITQ